MKQIRKYFHYSIKLFFLILLTFTFACSNSSNIKENNNQYETLKDYLKTKHNFDLGVNYKRIFILTDKNCHNCNRFFAKTIEKNLNELNSLFIVTASSSNIDLSSFKNSKNILFDRDNGKIKILEKSKIIFLNKKTIDTILNIELNNLTIIEKTIDSRK